MVVADDEVGFDELIDELIDGVFGEDVVLAGFGAVADADGDAHFPGV